MKLIKKSEHRLICQSNSFLIWVIAGIGMFISGLIIIIFQIEDFTACLKSTCSAGKIFQYVLMLLMGTFIIFIGSIIAVMVPRTRTIMDWSLNRIEVEKKWIFLNKTEKIEHALSDICSVEVEVYRDDDVTTYRVALFDKIGTSIPLSYDCTGNRKLMYEVAEKLRQFLRI